MRKWEYMVRVAPAVGVALALVMGACSAPPETANRSENGVGDKGSEGPDPSQFQGFQSFHPGEAAKTYHSGFDGTNEYVTPIAFFAEKAPKVTIADPSIAELQGGVLTINKSIVTDLPDALDGKIQLLLVRSKKAGKTTIRAVAGGLDQTATLKVMAYSAEDVSAGEKRYNEGAPSCNSCHERLNVHNPTVLADLSDETILGVAVDGKSLSQINPRTGQVETLRPNGGSHKWQVSDADRPGIVAFLRSRSLTFQLPSNVKK
jgi:mono/diheme cytochrome c family protein